MKRITSYTFDASAQTVTFSEYSSIDLERILLITNVTDNIIIYNFSDSALGGSVSTNVLTLTYNTTLMSDTDDLQIFYEDGEFETLSGADNKSNDTHTTNVSALSYMFDGSTWDRVRGDSTDGLLVNLGSNNDVSVSGTVTVDGSGVTQPISAASLPLPTGAATAANQSTIIGHVDGIEGLLTTIDADTSDIHTNTDTIAAGFATEGSALGSGVLLQGDDGTDRTNILVDTSGHLQIDVLTMPTTTVTGTVTANLSATDNAVLDTIETNTDFGTVTGGGTETGALRVTLANNSTGVLSVDDNGGALTVDNGGTFAVQVDGDALTALQLIDNIVQVEDAAHSSGHSGVMALSVRQGSATALAGTNGDYQPLITSTAGRLFTSATIDAALPTGSNTIGNIGTIATSVTPGTGATNLGKAVDGAAGGTDTGIATLAVRDDTTATLTPADGDYTHLRVNSRGALHVNLETNLDSTNDSIAVLPRTSGGLSIFRSIDLDETEEQVKGSAGQVYGWYIFNADASDTLYVKFYNATAANVTVGTTTPVMTIPVPSGAGANVEFTNGIEFDTAITVAATTGIADSDTGAPAANEVIVNVFYA